MIRAIVAALLVLAIGCGAKPAITPTSSVAQRLELAPAPHGAIEIDDYGAVCDGDLKWGTGTANDDAFSAAYAAATASGSKTRTIHFSACVYRFHVGPALDLPVRLMGEGGGAWPQTVLLLDPWAGGIKVHGRGQVPPPIAALGLTADGTMIEDMGIQVASTYYPQAWKANFTGGANLTALPTAGYLNDLVYVVQNVTSPPAHGGTVEPTWCTTVGCTVQDGGITFVAKTPSPGITSGASVIIRNVTIAGVLGNGFEVIAGGGNGAADEVRADNLRVISVAGHGIYVRGGEASCGLFTGANIKAAHGYGIWYDAFLSGAILSPIATANVRGPYRQSGLNNHADLINAYAEGGQPPTDWRSPGTILGGIHNSGFTPESSPIRDVAGNVEGRSYSSNANGRTLDLLPSSLDTIIGWHPGKRTDGTTRDSALGWSLIYDYPTAGWVGLSRANLKGQVAFAFSTGDAPEGAGHFWAPGDTYVGVGAAKRRQVTAFGTTSVPAVPPTILIVNGFYNFNVGDRCWNTTARVGDPYGWQVALSGGIPTWRPMGLL